MAAAKGSRTTVKETCTSRELQRKDCRLHSGLYNLRLLDKTVAWTDGTWRTVDPLPLVGAQIEWEKAQFHFLGGRPILQLWIWDQGTGEAQVGSLHWYIADAERRRLTILAEGVVRKRRRKSDVGEPTRYLLDGLVSHGLKARRGGGLEWRLGSETKLLP